MSPKSLYQQDIDAGHAEADAAQLAVIEVLETLHHQLAELADGGDTLFSRLFFRAGRLIPGLYLWGGVGRGKTWLVDLFYRALPFEQKRRIHYADFMLGIHKQLAGMPKSPDPLPILARKLSQRVKVLCLDEFHVDDITDAMILHGLLEGMFANGVTLVTTSNAHPDQLYLNGLQRDRFLPAIALLKQCCQVMELAGDQDFRQAFNQANNSFRLANAAQAETVLVEMLSPTERQATPATLTVNGRELTARGLGDDWVWFDYDTLCLTARSSIDYIHLAETRDRLIITHIPYMDNERSDAAQRFIQLVDALYDRRAKLICTADDVPARLYRGTALAGAFQRTASRLEQMRSLEYTEEARRDQSGV